MWIFSEEVLKAYKVDVDFMHVAKIYFGIGLINMVLMATYVSLDGILIASKQQKVSMLIALFLLITNISIDYAATCNIHSASSITFPFYVIGFSTTSLLMIAMCLALYRIIPSIQGWQSFSTRTMIWVWSSELGTYLVRGITPIIYGYQLCFITATTGFLITYQLSLQLSYLFCLPLLSSMQIAVREASETASNQSAKLDWKSMLICTGLIPTSLLIIIGFFAGVSLLEIFYDYSPAADHLGYLSIFFFSCWVGQIGNVLTIPLRARKLNHLVTINFILSELIVMICGTQLLIYFHLATPSTVALVTLLFTLTFLLLNFNCTKKINYI